jgi:hypothetical protein
MKSTIGEIAGLSPSHLRCLKLQGFWQWRKRLRRGQTVPEAWISLPIAQVSRNLSPYLLSAQCIADGYRLLLTFSPRTRWIVATSGLLASKQKAVAVRIGSSIVTVSEL